MFCEHHLRIILEPIQFEQIYKLSFQYRAFQNNGKICSNLPNGLAYKRYSKFTRKSFDGIWDKEVNRTESSTSTKLFLARGFKKNKNKLQNGFTSKYFSLLLNHSQLNK
jgi:hypothetical protein